MIDDDEPLAMTTTTNLPLTRVLPWELLAEFWTLDEVLTMRQVSHMMADAVQDLSPQACAALLSKALQERNVFAVPFGSWKLTAVQDLSEVLIRDTAEEGGTMTTTRAFDGMMRYFRVLKYLPMEAAVTFSGKYGRSCVPLSTEQPQGINRIVTYPSCQRNQCRTCRFRIPPADSSTVEHSAAIYNAIDIRGKKNNERLDLTRFYNTCIPNLPPDLICPSCRRTDERTLVLSALSYQSDSAAGRTLLTYTPTEDNEEEEEEPNDNDGDVVPGDDSNSNNNKRQRTQAVMTGGFAYPEIYHDVMTPSTWEPVEIPEDCKHAISIHCVACEQFGILSPAGPCVHPNFPCEERSRNVRVGNNKYPAVIGGVLVRRQCHKQDCLQSVLCESCSRQLLHTKYGRECAALLDHTDDRRFGQTTHVHFKNRCEACVGTYCRDCAWLTTVCHHS